VTRASLVALGFVGLAVVPAMLIASPFSGPFGGSSGGGGGGSVSEAQVLAIVADAGTLLRADHDAYANTFVAGAMSADGGPARYGYKCEQHPCTTDFGAGTQDEVTASGNTLTWNVSDHLFSTFHVTQPANTSNATVRWFADSGKFFGLFPTTDTTGCGAATDDNGGLRYVSTDQRFYGCDGTTLQRIGFSLSNTASVDFPSMAGSEQNTQTMTVTGALTTDAVTCSPLATPEGGVTFDHFQVTASNTVSITVHNHRTDPVDPASLSMKCIILR
jgi:hypothetical protein